MTDDNPRGEPGDDPSGSPRRLSQATEIGDRAEAIAVAIASAPDLLVVAGRAMSPVKSSVTGPAFRRFQGRPRGGHRWRRVRGGSGGMNADLQWESAAVIAATGNPRLATPGWPTASLSTADRGAGDLFVALRGDRFDGHDFLTVAAKKVP